MLCVEHLSVFSASLIAEKMRARKRATFSVVQVSRAPPQIIATGNNIYYSHHIAIATYLQSDRTSDSQDISPPERATLGHSL